MYCFIPRAINYARIAVVNKSNILIYALVGVFSILFVLLQ